MKTIGICDWGIGGVGVYTELRKLSSVNVVYFSDTGYTPYGKVEESELKRRLDKVFRWFMLKGVDYIIVGCNAASTVVEQQPYITGIIEHGINLVKQSGITSVGLVGGKRTVESEIYKSRLADVGIKVNQQIAQPLSARIEAGDIESTGLEDDIRRIFNPLLAESHILLACTHYPLIQSQITKYTGDKIFLDPAPELARWVMNKWNPEPADSVIEFYTSGDIEQMENSLKLLYQIRPEKIEKIEL